MLALIDRHGLAVLDQSYTTYTSNFKEQVPEIVLAVTQLRRELKVSVTFILDTPSLPHLSRSNYYYTLKKKNQDWDNQEIMVEIKAIYEEHKHRYGYRRITCELRRRVLLVNHKKVQHLMNKMKLFDIVSKRWHKYSNYRGTQEIIPTLFLVVLILSKQWTC